ncbi:hypothetical protein CkaCkLH20_08020 [Colletotrichum karsti]|uniref:Pkd domain containing protein n=1 Tax=Colletotrichum karsti TaxID=1095194 RepID=A0A9P6LJC9_9PEZI|nr:uncharacterized protein CkaCkLH20_08020 [Colletotrichum karsti]KAF9874457.1 hypothetical protein CkaCkLH20_08020 [Colletotrichum karsti]
MNARTGPQHLVLVTADNIDPIYNLPVIDHESHRVIPVEHYHVAGHFKNTEIRFNLYFPPESTWHGRFFQLAFPTQSDEATDETIGFAFESHAYAVQVTGTHGFQAEAAAAEFSRKIAIQHYGNCPRHVYGYIYGGSGGSLQVIGAMEKTIGIWDGAVPFVQAVPVSAPNNLCIRNMASLVLRQKASCIQETLKPGGSGDPFSVLNPLEKHVLQEAAELGVPIEAWEDFSSISDTSTLSLLTNSIIRYTDPEYMDDFWTKPGHLGTEPGPLGDFIRNSLVSFESIVRHVILGADGMRLSVELETASSHITSANDWYDFTILSSKNTKLGILTGTFCQVNKIAVFDQRSREQTPLLEMIAPGTRLLIDNKWSIAMRAYYRYQVPDRPGFYGFDRFRGPDGSSIFPKRPHDASKRLSEGASGGSTHTGKIQGKVIVVQNLLDTDAFPWHADWYRSQVKQSLGTEFDDNYRLWYNENADHDYDGPRKGRAALVVPYRGMVQQALRDLSLWVENNVPPPVSTSYSLSDHNAISVPQTAAERGGIQPVIHLKVEGCTKFKARVGQSIKFHAIIDVPPGAGKVALVEWDFFGKGRYTPGCFEASGPNFHATAVFTYNASGRFIVGLRAVCKRQDQMNSRYARVMNLSRVSVVVAAHPKTGNVFRL